MVAHAVLHSRDQYQPCNREQFRRHQTGTGPVSGTSRRGHGLTISSAALNLLNICRLSKSRFPFRGESTFTFSLKISKLCDSYRSYIMPPIPPPAGIAGAGSGISTIAHSVVRNIPATEAAFSRATRDTLVGSMTPASNMFTYSSVRAL